MFGCAVIISYSLICSTICMKVKRLGTHPVRLSPLSPDRKWYIGSAIFVVVAIYMRMSGWLISRRDITVALWNHRNQQTFLLGDSIELPWHLSPPLMQGVMWFTLSKNNQVIGIKSSNLDITHYSWEVVIVGTVDQFIGNQAVIDVYATKSADTTLHTKYKQYYQSDHGIYINLTNHPHFIVQTSGDNFVIKDTRLYTDVVTIEPFLCEKSNNLTGCVAISQHLSGNAIDTFVSLHGLIFYKIATDTWQITDGRNHGYILIGEDTIIYQLSTYMMVSDDALIEQLIRSQISNLCTRDGQTMVNIKRFEIRKQNNNTFAIIHGNTKNRNEAICQIRIDATDHELDLILVNVIKL